MQHSAQLGNPRVAAAAATKTPFPRGGLMLFGAAAMGGRRRPPEGSGSTLAQGLPRVRPWGRRRGAPTPFAPFWRDLITPSPVGRPRTPHRAPTRQKGEETTERHGRAGKARALPPQRSSRPLLFSSFCALDREKSRAWGGVAGLRERAPAGRPHRNGGWPWRRG